MKKKPEINWLIVMRKKEVIKMIGEEHWEEFQEFMVGQTVGTYKNGDTNFYEIDVENFLCEEEDRFFD